MSTKKSFLERLDDIRKSIVASEAKHHREHGCVYGRCACRCGCDGQTPCSLVVRTCMMCGLRENRDDIEHGLPSDIPAEIAYHERRIARLRELSAPASSPSQAETR